MKQGKNNEIDLLLRSLARGPHAEVSLEPGDQYDRENQAASDHLDADELSSFAEGVVPAPARARFISHLADCDNCRGIVVSLTQASGVVARSEAPDQQTGAGFWQKVEALFSPPVLRYAVPAIALTAVIAVSFFALRQQRRSDLVALNQETNSAAPAVAPRESTESPLAQSQAPAKTGTVGELRERLDSDREKTAAADDKLAAAKSSIATSDVDAPGTPTLKSPSQSKQPYDTSVNRPVFAPEPSSAPAPPPKSVVNEVDKVGEKEKVELSKREVQGLPVEEVRNQTRDEAGRHGPSRNNNAIGGAGRADGLVLDGLDSRAAKNKKDSEDEGETRSVAGRRFRRQGNAWIDTAYKSSRRTINVSRGSEQFRALIADEPAIRTIAEKLGGEVIVVSNGRAYRIH